MRQEVKWEDEGGWIRKGPQAEIQIRDACSVVALYVSMLPTG